MSKAEPTKADAENTPDTHPEPPADAESQETLPPLAEEVRIANLPEWQPSEYDPFVTLSGAEALAKRAVAPLVAAARGYSTVAGAADAKAAVESLHLGRRGTGKGGGPNAASRLSDAATSGDVLLIPVHRFDEVVEAEGLGREPNISTHQWRPWETVTMASGKESPKYDFAGGTELPITAHPAMPASWLNGDRTTGTYPPILCAEGQLKADAALSGLLLDAGVSRDDLGIKSSDVNGDGTPNVLAARGRLRQIMSNVAPEKRVAILATFSSTTWHGKSEWTQVSFRDRQVWIGMDADVAENPNVWRQANQFWEFIKTKHGVPRLLSPKAVKDRDETKKYGIDDYLAQLGEWSDLLKHLDNELPDNPGGPPEATKGAYMISEDGYSVLKAEQYDDTDGKTRYRWVACSAVSITALGFRTRRAPTETEAQTGVVEAVASSSDVVVGFKGRDALGRPHESACQLPDSILSDTNLGTWHKRALEAKLPGLPKSVLAGAWPPDHKDWAGIHGAMKPADWELPEIPEWTRQGWVPVPGRDVPAYIVGSIVVCDEGDEDLVANGVDRSLLPNVNMYGLDEYDPRPFDDPDYHAALRIDIQRYLDGFVRRGTWVDRGWTDVVVATALRACLPSRPKVPVLCAGTKGGGKTWTVRAVQSHFHARWMRASTSEKVFGNAESTTAALENTLYRAVLQTYDDVAPANSTSKAERSQDDLATVLRRVFNESAREKSSGSGEAQELRRPQAAFIAATENDVAVASAADRAMILDFVSGVLHPTEAVSTDVVNELIRDGVPARVAQGLIKYVRRLAHQTTPADGMTRWETFRAEVAHVRNSIQMSVRVELQGDTSLALASADRFADKAADFLLPLVYLGQMTEVLGVEDNPYCDEAGELDTEPILGLVRASMHKSIASSDGQRTIESLAAALASRRCYVSNASNPKIAPSLPSDPDMALALGWEWVAVPVYDPDTKTKVDEYVLRHAPSAECIGTFFVDGEGIPTILFEKTELAFAAAKKYGGGVLPEGVGSPAAWRSAHADGLTLGEDAGWKPKGSSPTLRRKSVGGKQRPGVPVWLETLRRGEKFDKAEHKRAMEARAIAAAEERAGDVF